MRITLVGKRNERRVICWRAWFKLTAATVATGAVLATVVYLLYAWRWNGMAPLAGMGAGFIASVVCIVVNLLTPLRRLPIIGNPPR